MKKFSLLVFFMVGLITTAAQASQHYVFFSSSRAGYFDKNFQPQIYGSELAGVMQYKNHVMLLTTEGDTVPVAFFTEMGAKSFAKQAQDKKNSVDVSQCNKNESTDSYALGVKHTIYGYNCRKKDSVSVVNIIESSDWTLSDLANIKSHNFSKGPLVIYSGFEFSL